MNAKNIIKLASIALLLLGIVAAAARFDRTLAPVMEGVNSGREVIALLEQHIPFAIETLPGIEPGDDVFELDLVVDLDEEGRDLVYTWRAMDGDTMLLECGDFYDLYYRCDGPSLFKVRVITRDHAGNQISVRRGLVSVD